MISISEMCVLMNQMILLVNNTYHSTIKMKPVNVKPSTYIESSKDINDKDPKVKICDIARISECKNIFGKGSAANWSEEVFVIKKVENTVACTYVISDLKGEEIVGTFYEKDLQKTNQKQFRAEKAITKAIKRKCNQLYVKWEGYNSSFNGWIDK